jgi:NADPH:quinone reductase-like Zn-dependent oxidoreductase
MKAIVYHRYGTPDALHLAEVAKPSPRDNELLVKVYASSVNSWDWDLLRGKPFLTRVAGGLFRPKYPVIGADVAGRVEAAGKDVKQFRVGDEVYGDLSGCNWGGFAEYVCAAEHAWALKPAGITFDEAAAVPQAGVLALQGLRNKGHLQNGQKVLINGAGGGVGTFAVQIAKAFGAEVTGVDSTKKLEMLRSIGADHVIDYTKEDFTKSGKRYDLILDVVVQRSAADCKRALNAQGTYIIIGGASRPILQALLLGRWINRQITVLLHKPDQKDLDFITSLIEAGKVKPVIDSRYPLGAVPEALRYFGEGRVKGKIVITVNENR